MSVSGVETCRREATRTDAEDVEDEQAPEDLANTAVHVSAGVNNLGAREADGLNAGERILPNQSAGSVSAEP